MSTTIEAALRWLEERDPPPPFELHRRLQRVIERTPGEHASVQDLMVDAGFNALRGAIRIGDDRSAAKDLLAADALFTYACEVAAEQGLDTLDQLLMRMEIEDFEALLPQAAE